PGRALARRELHVRALLLDLDVGSGGVGVDLDLRLAGRRELRRHFGKRLDQDAISRHVRDPAAAVREELLIADDLAGVVRKPGVARGLDRHRRIFAARSAGAWVEREPARRNASDLPGSDASRPLALVLNRVL